ncbi:MAG: type IX secretion system membrane protein PorP/SprF [Flavobacteriales bacterium]|nr:type IX secretion system membrane protein PorP/SprF [Flavobacteriales bacterium]
MKARLLILVVFCMGVQQVMRAQDPQLSQFYAAPIYLNPALTGNTQQDRVIMNYRLQWAGIPPGFNTYAVAYDHRAPSLNSGFGGYVMRDVAGTNRLAFTQAAFAYAYEARLSHKSGIRAGLRLGYTHRSYDPSKLLFADQIIRDNAGTSIEPGLTDRVGYMDASAGAMYYTRQFWAGASFNHLNRPQQTFYFVGNTRLPVRTSIHTGYKFPLDGRSFTKSDVLMTLTAHYKAQDKWDQLDLGGYIEYRNLTGGLWYRGLPGLKAYQPGYPNHEAVILMVGVETLSNIRFVYSYDITISWLGLGSGGAHEVSLAYEWPKQKGRKHKSVPCPKF